MLSDVDLPAPGLLWTRWATIAAALAGIGHDDVWFVDERGAHHDDHDGSWARFALIEGVRAVLYGYDREHSATAVADPPVDLLTGAPDWLPWEDLTALAEADELGFVVWHAEGRWSRVRYATADGLVQTVAPVLSGENTLRELAEVVAEWGGHQLSSPAERDDVRAAGAELLAAAVRGQVTAVAFEQLLGRLTDPALDVRAALASARRAGLTPGTRPARIPAGERPAMRRVRRLSQAEHDRLVWEAMHEATELPRPAPPATAQLDALTERLREGHGTVRAYADGASLILRTTGAADDLADLVRALRRAESDPRYGRWLFLWVAADETGVRVQRRYDSWPPWWDDDGISGPWRTHLLQEMTARHEKWRPAWVRLLDPEVAYRPA